MLLNNGMGNMADPNLHMQHRQLSDKHGAGLPNALSNQREPQHADLYGSGPRPPYPPFLDVGSVQQANVQQQPPAVQQHQIHAHEMSRSQNMGRPHQYPGYGNLQDAHKMPHNPQDNPYQPTPSDLFQQPPSLTRYGSSMS